MWQNPKHRFISPLRSVGIVVSNAKISSDMVNAAYTNRTPYWGVADGTAKNFVGIMQRGEIVYQYHDRRGFGVVSNCSTDPQYIERENTTQKGLTILNGQGDSILGNMAFASTIQVMGIVEMSNTNGNCKGLFNLITGGILDVRNNGNETINVGDSVYAYPPERDEIHKGGGRTPNADEKNGVAKLWYKPYRPELHRFQLKQIYDCLRDVAREKNYLPKYRDTCHKLIDSATGMFMVIFATMSTEIKKAMIGPNRIENEADLYVHLLAKAGHSDFKGHSSADPALASKIIDALFVTYSINSKNASEYIFSLESENLTKRERDLRQRLNTIQRNSTGLYQEAMASFVAQLRDLIVGQAKSTARPGDDFSLMLTLD